MGGPARTRSASGITNADWFVTLGGDGFRSQVDPEDPNTVYSALQNGVLSRFDKRTGERMGIQPQPGRNDEPNRWNWDSPFIISPHLHTRLTSLPTNCFAATIAAIVGKLSAASSRADSIATSYR